MFDNKLVDLASDRGNGPKCLDRCPESIVVFMKEAILHFPGGGCLATRWLCQRGTQAIKCRFRDLRKVVEAALVR